MVRRGTSRSRRDLLDRYDIVATFGANLKVTRLKMRLTQEQLAEATGLLQQYISLVESGRQNITLTTAQVLATAVDRDVRALLARPRRRPING